MRLYYLPRLIGLFLLPLIFNSATSQEKTRSEYYAIIPFYESPLTPFKGAYPISQETAQEMIHLRLDFDSNNRVKESRVMIGDHLKAFQEFFALYINAPLVKVSYEENKEVHHFFDHFEKPISVMNNVFTKVYEKDDFGRNIQLTYLDSAGNQASDFFGFVKYTWTYESEGTVIEERFNEAGDLGALRGAFQLMRTRIIYDDNGYPHVLQNVDEDGRLQNTKEGGVAYFKYFYDLQGRFKRWEVYDEDGNKAIGPSNTAGELNTYKSYYLESINFFDTEGNTAIHWSGVERWFHEYDKFGNRTRRLFQSAEGTMMNNNGGYAEYRNEWSEDGRWLVSTSFFDHKGEPVNNSRGITKTEYKRDNAGRILDTMEFEVKGLDIVRKD